MRFFVIGTRGGVRGGCIRAPLVGRCCSVGTIRPSTVLLFQINSFCRAFNRSTVGTDNVLNVALAQHTGNSTACIRLTKFPCRAVSACLPGLIQTNRHITVYRRLRSPGRIEKLIGHNIVRLIAPNIILNSGVLTGGRGTFLTSICFNHRAANITFLSVSANRFCITRNSRDCVSGLVSGLTPGRIVCRHNCRSHFSSTFKSGLCACHLSR